MPGEAQPLVNNQPIVDANGLPTQYFIRWAQERQIDISEGIDATQAQQLIDDWAASRQIIAGVGLSGGGPLSSDVTIDLEPLPFGFSYTRSVNSITLGQEMMGFDAGISWTMPAGLANSQGNVTAGPVAQTDFDIKIAGASVGTLRFAAAATTATFIKAATSVVAAGTRCSVTAPANLNGMTGILDFTILGTRP